MPCLFHRGRMVLPDDFHAGDNFSKFWSPITDEELGKASPKSSSSPGPDGVRPLTIKKLNSFTLAKLMNVFLFLGRLPHRLLVSKTIFIPKKAES